MAALAALKIVPPAQFFGRMVEAVFSLGVCVPDSKIESKG